MSDPAPLGNIQNAERVALKYWILGYVVICPHKNSALFDGALPDKVWLEGALELLRRCDVIVMMQNYKTSMGAMFELQEAKRLGLEILYEERP